MTDYNDGNWHGWNGGECPVHPETIVDIATEHGPNFPESKASSICGWEDEHLNPIVAFRVTKPYVEPPKPAEKWLVGNHAFDKKEAAERFVSELIAKHGDKYASPEWQPRLFREVQE